MRNFIIIILSIITLSLVATEALADSSVRFDWSLGESLPVEDATDSNTPEFSWVLGEPTVTEEYVLSAVVPTVTTQAATNITDNSATGNGNITATGGENCDKRGFVYGTSSQSDPGNTAPESSGYDSYAEDSGSFGTGAFTKGLTSLSSGQKYYIRAYAHNSAGYSYGGEQEFTTYQPRPPGVGPSGGGFMMF